jgi:uncharacterized protein YgiM (DUF1202 family)
MMQFILTGITLCATTLLVADGAKATPVVNLCPQATWTVGYDIGEFIPLAQSQYKTGLVTRGPSHVRSGAGFESAVLLTLDPGSQVTIIGEAWDGGCNHWLRIMVESELYWMHGSQLQII